ncbi:MAG: GNAT family N-acetyltransferase [Tannerellaceae bacterium]|jgi:RimJ/RimL family protein N-acetyltransferase|nr:GNAT family N-acetyltransferase [Tannerellaceae bacterium]
MYIKDFELREWQLSDAASLAENANNIQIWNNLRDALPHPYTEEDGKQFITMAMSMPKPATLMAIEVDGKAVGSIGITLHTDVERITVELGYFIGESYWSRGIMTEVVKEMVSYVFLHFPELKKIYATTFDFNIASQRVLQKAGFEREGVLKQAAIKNRDVIDLHYYSMLKSQWILNVHHRFFRQEDFPLLENLLYEAIFQPEGAEPLPRDIIKKPEIYNAIRDFGEKQGDFCIFAELNGITVGGAWLRLSDDEPRSYGYIDSETPELAIAVFKPYQKLGIGRGLMNNLIDLALTNGIRGYKQISLSVDKRNYAVEMYKKIGFEIVKENEQDYVMVLKRNVCREQKI